jgi:hypothetical protein
MNTFTADAVVQSVLVTLTEPTEIRSSSGQVLGYFTPAQASQLRKRTAEEERLYEIGRSILDPKEFARIKASSDPGISTAELLAKLERLEAR